MEVISLIKCSSFTTASVIESVTESGVVLTATLISSRHLKPVIGSVVFLLLRVTRSDIVFQLLVVFAVLVIAITTKYVVTARTGRDVC